MGLWRRPGKSRCLKKLPEPSIFALEQFHSDSSSLERVFPALIGPLDVDVTPEVQVRLVGEAVKAVGFSKVFPENGAVMRSYSTPMYRNPQQSQCSGRPGDLWGTRISQSLSQAVLGWKSGARAQYGT